MEIAEIAKRLGRPEKEFLRRLDGRVEWQCEHGVGHTVWYPKGSDGIHGCDGCCHKMRKENERQKRK